MIRIMALIFLLLCAGYYAGAQEDYLRGAAQANAAYETGDYANAINLYEALIAGGVQDYRLYFNLGNAYYQARNPGKALLNYRRAHQLSPRDNDVISSLARVRSQRRDVLGEETSLIDSIAAFTSGVMTTGELNWLAFSAWTALFGLLMAWGVRQDWRTALRLPVVLTALFFAGMVLLAGSRLWVEYARPAALVVESTATVMSGPGENYLEIYRLSTAAELRVLEKRGEWVRFILPDERQGWLPEALIDRV